MAAGRFIKPFPAGYGFAGSLAESSGLKSSASTLNFGISRDTSGEQAAERPAEDGRHDRAQRDGRYEREPRAQGACGRGHAERCSDVMLLADRGNLARGLYVVDGLFTLTISDTGFKTVKISTGTKDNLCGRV